MKYRTSGPWGVGEAGNLTAPEVDANFYELAQLADAAQAARDALPTVSLHGISVNGYNRLVFDFGTDYRVGFSLPRESLVYKGTYAAGRSYSVGDYFSAPGYGAFLVLEGHISGPTFSPWTETTEGPLYAKCYGESLFMDWGAYCPGTLLTGQRVVEFPAPRALVLPAGVAGYAYARIAPDADLTLALRANGNVVAWFEFSAGQHAATASVLATETLAAGGLLAVSHFSGAVDVARDFSFSLVVWRA